MYHAPNIDFFVLEISSQVINGGNFSGLVLEKSSTEDDYASIRFPGILFGQKPKCTLSRCKGSNIT